MSCRRDADHLAGDATMEWTDERIALLTRLWQEGQSASQVARQLGSVSRSAVIGKIHRLGIAGRDRPTSPRSLGGRPPRSPRPASTTPRRPVEARIAREPRPAPYVVFEADATATLITLSDHGCRWPIGEPDQAGFGFCGRQRAGRGSYCEGHSPMASRRRAVMPEKQIDQLIGRYGDAPAHGFRKTANG
jgi:GcrA cell cycle regulator